MTGATRADAQRAAEIAYPSDGYLEVSLLPEDMEDPSIPPMARSSVLLVMDAWAKAALEHPELCEITVTMPGPCFGMDRNVVTHTWKGSGGYSQTSVKAPSGGKLSMELSYSFLELLVHRWAVEECKFPHTCQVAFFDPDDPESGPRPASAMVTVPIDHSPTERPPAVTDVDHDLPVPEDAEEEDPEDCP